MARSPCGCISCKDVLRRDAIALIGGTNAALWLQPAETIIAELERDLAALPHRRGLIITSAGVMPPAASPETLRTVGRWVQSQPG